MLYYPLSTKEYTFENIFSTESVSPPSFYPMRNYGIGYFFIVPDKNLKNVITLYSAPPVYSVETGIKFILQIDESSLDMDSLLFLEEGVFGYLKTIYLNADNFKMLFFSEKDAKISVLKSKSSLPTKSLEKYLGNFLQILDSDCKDFNVNLLDIERSNSNIRFYILQDKKFNHFKGLIYGLVCGMYNKSTHEGIPFKKALRELINTFGEYKSRISYKPLPREYSKERNRNVFELANNLFSAIDLLEHTFLETFPLKNLDRKEITRILFEKVSHLNSLEEAERYITYVLVDDEIYGTNKFQDLQTKFAKTIYDRTKLTNIDILRDQISLFIESAAKKNLEDFDQQNSNIKLTFNIIERDFSDKLQKNSEKSNFQLEKISYDFMNNEIQIAEDFYGLTTEELRDVNVICNTILRYVTTGKENGKELVLRIVEDTGQHFSKTSKQTNLYQYLNNQIDEYSLEKVTSPVLRNFVAFIFNFDSLEKLESFIVNKNVQQNWIAYVFWGTFNGFASLSGNFTKLIFSQDGKVVQTYIDKYLAHYIDTLNNFNYDDNSLNSVNESQAEEYSNSQVHLIDEFYKKFVNGKFRLTKDEFSSVYSIKDKETFYNNVKTKFKMNKKTADKLFNSIKRDFDSPLLFN